MAPETTVRFIRLTQLSNWLSRIPSLVYGIIYLALIPFFAGIFYCGLRDDFYHATVQYEPGSLPGVEGSIRSEFLKALYASSAHGLKNPQCNGWAVSEIYIQGIAVQYHKVDISLTLYLDHPAPQKDVWAGIWLFPFRLSLDRTTYESNAVAYFHASSDQPLDPPRGDALNTKQLIQCMFPASYPGGRDAGYLAIPLELGSSLDSLARAKMGFPGGIPGQFYRMLYLSATIITTLGFGDIVPLTSAARLAVASEAIIGIVFMGLFLNSVGKPNKE
jgi:hypothetical protein